MVKKLLLGTIIVVAVVGAYVIFEYEVKKQAEQAPNNIVSDSVSVSGRVTIGPTFGEPRHFGQFDVEAVGGDVLPHCPKSDLFTLEPGAKPVVVNISCDSGIR